MSRVNPNGFAGSLRLETLPENGSLLEIDPGQEKRFDRHLQDAGRTTEPATADPPPARHERATTRSATVRADRDERTGPPERPPSDETEAAHAGRAAQGTDPPPPDGADSSVKDQDPEQSAETGVSGNDEGQGMQQDDEKAPVFTLCESMVITIQETPIDPPPSPESAEGPRGEGALDRNGQPTSETPTSAPADQPGIGKLAGEPLLDAETTPPMATHTDASPAESTELAAPSVEPAGGDLDGLPATTSDKASESQGRQEKDVPAQPGETSVQHEAAPRSEQNGHVQEADGARDSHEQGDGRQRLAGEAATEPTVGATVESLTRKPPMNPRPVAADTGITKEAGVQPEALQGSAPTSVAAPGEIAAPSLAAMPQQLARAAAPPSASQPLGTEVERVRFVQRVARAFQAVGDKGGSIQLRLRPPELGSLRLELSVKDGALTARLETENSAARNALLDNLPALRERLAQQDIRIERFDVDLNQEQSAGSHRQPGDHARAGQRSTSDASESPAAADAGSEDASTPALVAPNGDGLQLNVVV